MYLLFINCKLADKNLQLVNREIINQIKIKSDTIVIFYVYIMSSKINTIMTKEESRYAGGYKTH